MTYKDKIYESYRTTHNSFLYGSISLEKIEKQFPVLDFYFEKHLPPNSNAAILDLGCGDGGFVYYLQKRGFHSTFGVDISPEQIELGIELGINGLKQADIREYLKLKKEQYDLIVARDVLEHFPRQEVFEILEQCFLALKPQGNLIVQVPNGMGINVNSIFYRDLTHEMAYTMESFRQIALAVGFKQIKAFPINPFPNGLKGKLRAFLWKLKVLQTRFWLMIETGSSKGIFTANILISVSK